jgi:hypothetical protein
MVDFSGKGKALAPLEAITSLPAITSTMTSRGVDWEGFLTNA